VPLKLIGFILFMVVIFAFIGFNLDNSTNINIWVNEKGHFEDVSVIIVVFTAYLFGLLTTVPFWFARTFSRSRSKKREKMKNKASLMAEANQVVKSKKGKKIFSSKKKTVKDEEI
jgi:uncharacterized integral membrane protein